ncbi:MAG: mediator complex subunit [Phylliscum demangeonii]|nr:MAG: mediator complex subunit [Phylliscum demangeonii]
MASITPPPPMDHVSVGYQPLSKLITRLVQDTFNELTEVIEAMSQMPTSDSWNGHTRSHYQANHSTASDGEDDTPANVDKKMRLMNFAQQRRAQFIKILVLAQWSRHSDDVSRVIDLKVWMDKQLGLYDELSFWLVDLKRALGPAKQPNPDLNTALEVLSTGKVAGFPDLGYIPPPPLTPQQIRKTLRNLNVLLSIRLNLHETIPAAFEGFTINSGRVTFSVPDEFEVDVSIADEDPKSQFFFIDFRFLFQSASKELPPGRIRDEIEAKVNTVLLSDGLFGCYHFLHELVITHKINVLRKQAFEMSRNRWNEWIKIETVHRALVLQYWLNRPGAKSWIEIGVFSGKAKNVSSRSTESPTSIIACRWFPDGKEVKDAAIQLPRGDLSMESILKNVVAIHITRLLGSIRNGLYGAPSYSGRHLSLDQVQSASEPGECLLKIQLTPSTSTTLIVEPVTGRFALLPASPLSTRAEVELNNLKQPMSEGHRPLYNLRCALVMEEIDSRARCVGWEAWKTFAPKQDDLRRIFPRDTWRVAYFRRNGWRKDWTVAVSVGIGGEQWWIIEVLEAPIGYLLGDFERIPTRSVAGKAIDPTYGFLSHLAKVAAGMISNYVNIRALSRLGIQHALHLDSSLLGHLPTILIRFSSLTARSALDRNARSWAKELLKVRCVRVSPESGQVIMMTEARLLQPIPHLDLVRDRVDDDIVFHPPSGSFAFQVATTVGDPFIPQLHERLTRIGRLISFLKVVSRFNLACETISLGRIVFIYAPERGYKADLRFAGGMPVDLKLPQGNPHLRIRDFLVKLLNDGDDRGSLEHVMLMLAVTLPLMQAFDDIERTQAEAGTAVTQMFVLPRSAGWYQVRYTRPASIVDIQLRQRRREVKWFLRESAGRGGGGAGAGGGSSSNGHSTSRNHRPAALADALKALFNGRGQGWVGLRTGIAADIDGVPDLVRRLDRVLRDHSGADGDGDATMHSPPLDPPAPSVPPPSAPPPIHAPRPGRPARLPNAVHHGNRSNDAEVFVVPD